MLLKVVLRVLDLAHCWHVYAGSVANSIFSPPQAGGCLPQSLSNPVVTRYSYKTYLGLSVEVDATLSVERNITKETALVPTPREHRKRNWDRNVDSDLANLDITLEFTSSRS